MSAPVTVRILDREYTVGVSEAELPFVFLASGALSLFTSPRIGRLADRWGRLQVFTGAALLSLPIIAFMSRSGPLPLWLAVVLGAGFFGYAVALWRSYSDALARKTFRFSLVYLSVLFAALLIDHYVTW